MARCSGYLILLMRYSHASIVMDQSTINSCPIFVFKNQTNKDSSFGKIWNKKKRFGLDLNNIFEFHINFILIISKMPILKDLFFHRSIQYIGKDIFSFVFYEISLFLLRAISNIRANIITYLSFSFTFNLYIINIIVKIE